MSDSASGLSERELAELCALADGTLPAERRPLVEARVAASPELQELLDRQRRAVAATQALEADPVPESLRVAVDANRRTAPPGRSRAARGALRLALVGGAAVLVAVLILVLTGGPIAPTVAEAAQLGTQSPSEPAPAARDDSETQLALDVEGVVFPNLLRSFGWQAVGVDRTQLDGRDATTVYYEKDSRRIAYVIVAGPALSRPSEAEDSQRDNVLFQTFRVDNRVAVTWRRAGHTCVLIGDAEDAELLALASWRGDGTLNY
jgi:anti-sigma factor RsiW